MEKLAHSIRANNLIKGVTLRGKEYKLFQYADDATIFSVNGDSLERILSTVQDFSKVSDLRINLQKSKILRIDIDTRLLTEGSKLQEVESMDVLGLTFYVAKGGWGRCYADYAKYLDKMRLIYDKWRKRKLNLKTEVTVLNTLMFPVLYYTTQNSYCPPFVEEEVRKLTSNLVWNDHRPKISMNTLYQLIAREGLGLHNLFERVLVARIAWVKRMILRQADDFWLEFLCWCCEAEDVLDIICRHQKANFRRLMPFYRNFLMTCQKYYAVHSNLDKAIKAEPLWRNKFI